MDIFLPSDSAWKACDGLAEDFDPLDLAKA